MVQLTAGSATTSPSAQKEVAMELRQGLEEGRLDEILT